MEKEPLKGNDVIRLIDERREEVVGFLQRLVS